MKKNSLVQLVFSAILVLARLKLAKAEDEYVVTPIHVGVTVEIDTRVWKFIQNMAKHQNPEPNMANQDDDLTKNGDVMGCQQLNSDESKLKVCNTPENYDEASSNGSQNGGVMQCIKLFVEVYPKESTKVPDTSEAPSANIISSSTMSFNNLFGLFIIVATVLFSSLLLLMFARQKSPTTLKESLAENGQPSATNAATTPKESLAENATNATDKILVVPVNSTDSDSKKLRDNKMGKSNVTGHGREKSSCWKISKQ